MQLPSLEDVVNGLVNFVANAVSKVVEWVGGAVGWLWSTIYSYIVKPIGDFISWLFEAAKSVLVQPVLGFIGAALGTLQRKAFGTLYIAITYKLMLAEAKKIMEASSAKEAIVEFLWLMVKPIVIYLALSAAWKLLTGAVPAEVFTTPPWLPAVPSLPSVPVAPPVTAPGAPMPWTLALYDRLETAVLGGVARGLVLEAKDVLDLAVTGDVVLPGQMVVRDVLEAAVLGGVKPPVQLTVPDALEVALDGGVKPPVQLVAPDTLEVAVTGGAAFAWMLTVPDSLEVSVLGGAVIEWLAGGTETDLLIVWEASVS
jgi:hypothetical protein